MIFDPRIAKILQPGKHMLVSGCPGLRLVASKTSKTWTYRYEAVQTKQMKQVTLGRWPGTSVQTAMGEWQTLRNQRAGGVVPITKRKAAIQFSKEAVASKYSVNQLVSDYYNERIDGNHTPNSAKAVKRMLDSVADTIGIVSAKDIDRPATHGFLTSKLNTPTIAAKTRSLMAAATDHALDSGKLDSSIPNHWRRVMEGQIQSKGKIKGGEHVGQTRRRLQDYEVSTLLSWVEQMHQKGRDATIMYFWMASRGGEFLSMRPEYITAEADGYWFTLPKALTKNRRKPFAVDYRTPLIGRALEITQRRIKEVGASGWLFEKRTDQQYTQHDFSTYVYSLMPDSVKLGPLKCPVAGWTPHDLRRTSRSILTALGCPENVGEAILGHLPRAIVGTYDLHTFDTEKREWLGKLADRLEQLAV